MQPDNLKAKFDRQVSFCGGVDTQDLLPNGTPEDVPPANIKALFDEATKIY